MADESDQISGPDANQNADTNSPAGCREGVVPGKFKGVGIAAGL